MAIRFSVSALKTAIRADNHGATDPVDLARVELNGVLALLDFKTLSFGTLEVPDDRREPIYRAIRALWPWPDRASKYKTTLNLILTTIRHNNIVAVETKSEYERVDFPCDAWCKKSANATQEQIERAGGLSPSFATEICYDQKRRWEPKTFIFGFLETKIELPLRERPAGEEAPASKIKGTTYGGQTYFFLVPRGTFVYSPRGSLRGELAFPDLLSIGYIWFVGDKDGIRRVSWKKDRDPSELPQPSATAARLQRLEERRRAVQMPSVLLSSSSEDDSSVEKEG